MMPPPPVTEWRPSHYPSWGLKTPEPCPVPPPAHPHYPSWGLKTPEPCPVPPPAHPHYPSWGLKTFVGSLWTIAAPDSLPLMGIENYDHFGRCAEDCPPHYPSWGLKTVLAGHGGLLVHTSLPLMGIENRRRTTCARIWRASSLPLMGIENRSRCGCVRNRPIAAHYPSWGLKTRDGRGCGRAARRAHYPSWGLKTIVPLGRASAVIASLPLMGIENRSRQRNRALEADPLITPHGD